MPESFRQASAKSSAEREGPVTPSRSGTASNRSCASAAIGSRFARVMTALNGARCTAQASTPALLLTVAR